MRNYGLRVRFGQTILMLRSDPNLATGGYTLQLRIKLRKKSNVLRPLLDSTDPNAKLELVLHEKFLVGITFPTIHQHALDMDELCKQVYF